MLLENRRQATMIRDYMLSHGGWRTLARIQKYLVRSHPDYYKDSPPVITGVSASLRSLRKEPYGCLVDKQYVGNGVWEYRVRLRKEGESRDDEVGADAVPRYGKYTADNEPPEQAEFLF